MKSFKYITKSGLKQFKPVCTEEKFITLSEENIGWCLACGTDANGVEPDARKYTCEECNKPKVYGLEELLMMGLVTFKNKKNNSLQTSDL
jgi:hypothetical protein